MAQGRSHYGRAAPPLNQQSLASRVAGTRAHYTPGTPGCRTMSTPTPTPTRPSFRPVITVHGRHRRSSGIRTLGSVGRLGILSPRCLSWLGPGDKETVDSQRLGVVMADGGRGGREGPRDSNLLSVVQTSQSGAFFVDVSGGKKAACCVGLGISRTRCQVATHAGQTKSANGQLVGSWKRGHNKRPTKKKKKRKEKDVTVGLWDWWGGGGGAISAGFSEVRSSRDLT